MSFTISQQPDSANLFLYPNGDDTVALSRNTGSYNYECVDDVWHSPDEDTSFVYTTSTTEVEDKYTLQDHGSVTGTINYVRVIGRGRADGVPQASSGVYKFFVDDGTTVGYSSNFAPLSTTYTKKDYTWNNKPSGGSWSWTDIDNIKVGVRCSTPLTSATFNDVFRPNANGDSTDFETVYGDTTHYLCVDEEIADDSTTYVKTEYADAKHELFNIPDHTTSQTGTINSVIVYARLKRPQASTTKICIKIGGTVYYGDALTLSSSWETKSQTWTTNPNTGSAWTWTDIDNLQIGVYAYNTTSLGLYCTQVYAVVNYTKDISPEIRTTQVYTVVNYTPAQTSVTLNDPISLEVTHSRRVQRFLFGSGDYEVSDFGRAGKTLVLSGMETTDTENKMNTLKTMTHYGKYVTVSGLPDSNLDGNYYITDFNWNKREGYVDVVDWSLTLEEA